jgi:hypothetical protein
VQAADSILGPVNQVSSPIQVVTAGDPIDQKLVEEQSQQEQKQDSDDAGDDDDSSDAGTDTSLGLINSGPVQLKNDLEAPITSGGMDTVIIEPGTPD